MKWNNEVVDFYKSWADGYSYDKDNKFIHELNILTTKRVNITFLATQDGR